MVKLNQGYLKSRLPEALSSSSDSEDLPQPKQQKAKVTKRDIAESDESEDELKSYEEVDSDIEIAAVDEKEDSEEGDFDEVVEKKFGQRGVNDEAKILERLAEIRANFYNRLSSKKLINSFKGRIPFTEHMTISTVSHFNNHPYYSKRSPLGCPRVSQHS